MEIVNFYTFGVCSLNCVSAISYVLMFMLGVCAGCNIGSPKIEVSDLPEVKTEVGIQWDVSHDLITLHNSSFYGEEGDYFGPSMPGWPTVSGSDRKGLWTGARAISTVRPHTEHARMGSWLLARAGSLRLPISQDRLLKPQLRFWFFSPAVGQAASVFFDGKTIATVSMKQGWAQYTVELPNLRQGEHRLRFWFRHSFTHSGMRTPGALGGLQISDASSFGAWHHWSKQQLQSELPAPSNSKWQYYLGLFQSSRLQGTFRSGDTPTVLEILADSDTAEPSKLYSARLEPQTTHSFSVPLPMHRDSATRLVFKVAQSDVKARWTKLKIERQRGRDTDLSRRMVSIKKMVVVVLDGLSKEDLRLLERGVYPVTPTLDRLSQEGLIFPHVFTGGDTLNERLNRILGWTTSWCAQSSPCAMRQGFFTQPKARLSKALSTYLDREMTRIAGGTEGFLGEVKRWLELGRSEPYILTTVLSLKNTRNAHESTLAVNGISMPQSKPTANDVRRSAAITALDQTLSELIGMLSHTTSLNDTLFMVVGHKTPLAQSLQTADPRDYFSPIIFWMNGRNFGQRISDIVAFDSLLEHLRPTGAEAAYTLSLPSPSTLMQRLPDVSRGLSQLTAVLHGPWLLLLQDAKRYGLYRFDKDWQAFGRRLPITQRAMRVLVSQ